MRSSERRLDESNLLEDLEQRAFAASAGATKVGLEVELLAFRGIQAVSIADFLGACQPLLDLGELTDLSVPGQPRTFGYGAIRFTFEPGGQLELISPPRPTATQALEDIRKLEMLLDRVLSWSNIRRAGHGANPWQDEHEVGLETPEPRYRAMQAYFNEIGPAGMQMMRLTCALQINIDTGEGDTVGRRWRLANALSPFLTGLFANSPMLGGRLTGWKSSRAAIWQRVDPTRTGSVLGENGPADYLQFALNANVMLRRFPDRYVPGRPGFTFRRWLNDGDELGYPDLADWQYHLTTLFPSVRARGFFELRSMDTPPIRWRSVPVAVATALLLDVEAREASLALLDPLMADLFALAVVAGRDGLGDPGVGRPAARLVELAMDAFPRLPSDWVTPQIVSDVHAFYSQFTARGRCPADELLDLRAHGRSVADLALAAARAGETIGGGA